MSAVIHITLPSDQILVMRARKFSTMTTPLKTNSDCRRAVVLCCAAPLMELADVCHCRA
jgi:hypothetical protein